MWDSNMVFRLKKNDKGYGAQTAKIVKSIHTKNLQMLPTKMFKVYQNILSTNFIKIFLRVIIYKAIEFRSIDVFKEFIKEQ